MNYQKKLIDFCTLFYILATLKQKERRENGIES